MKNDEKIKIFFLINSNEFNNFINGILIIGLFNLIN